MSFAAGETLYLMDEAGKRYWFRFEASMIKLGGLGAIDGSRFADLDDGDSVTIAGKKFNIFRPTVVDLMASLDRGAQIITPKDASIILLECNIHAGTKVIEVGAGSGGLTTALTAAVAPSGHVHTLELRAENAERVLKNLKRTGLDAYWSYQIGDARTMDIDYGMADVVTTDMPDPENAIDNLSAHLRNGGILCTYVPNVNQLDLCVRALRKKGFADVRSFETLRRGMEVHAGGVRPSFEMLGHTGYLTFARKKA